eukprot:2171989-Karenia_brevis.AAC.1
MHASHDTRESEASERTSDEQAAMAAADAEADSNIAATVKRLKEMKLEVKSEDVKSEDEKEGK